jgi:hypothetical protein
VKQLGINWTGRNSVDAYAERGAFEGRCLVGAAALDLSNLLMRLNTLNDSVRSSYTNSDTSSAVIKSP